MPKTIHLVELIHGQLYSYSQFFGNQFSAMSDEVAGFFQHSGPDLLLADLFAKRALPAEEYELAVAKFLKEYVTREKSAHALKRQG